MRACADVVGVVLAAGQGRRFGGNKLEAMFEGEMLGMHAARTLASAIGGGRLLAIHDPAHAALARGLQEAGFALVANDRPTLGLSHSLSLAIAATMKTDAQAILVCLGDMPRISIGHLELMLATNREDPQQALASIADDIRSPPALFPRALWPALATMSGDQGARSLLGGATGIETAAGQLRDVDFASDLNALISGQN